MSLNGQMAANSSPDYQAYSPVPAATVQTETVRKARDKAQYVRQQKGHSLTLHILLGWIVLYIPTIYYSISPNHYWHA